MHVYIQLYILSIVENVHFYFHIYRSNNITRNVRGGVRFALFDRHDYSVIFDKSYTYFSYQLNKTPVPSSVVIDLSVFI